MANDAALAGRIAIIEVQLAAMTGMFAAIVEVLPLGQRVRILEKLRLSFETMHASLLANAGPESEIAIRAIETMRTTMLGDPTDG